MRLKKLVVHGFKSFPEHVEMTFENGITGVVGPNGCGKSNISDAVRWVLGEQSAKSLRGTKMEDVIFNGTEKRRRLAFCEVMLIFDNADRSLPLDFSEIAVSRRVYRSGEGEYSINGNACRLRDIVQLFHDTGIGKEGYSIIGQGRIDDILSAKSEDRRKVFEEAAGIVKYKTRKQDAERKIENMRMNINRVEDIIAELEERVEPLREQSEAAREFLTLRDELKALDLNVFLMRTERYQERIADLKASIEALTAELEVKDEALVNLSAERAECEAALDRLEIETAGKRDAVQLLIRDVEAREGAVNVMRERIASGEAERERLNAEKTAALEGGEGVSRRIEQLNEAISNEGDELNAARLALEAKEAELNAAQSALDALESESEAKKADIISAMNKLGDVKNQQARLSAMQTALEAQLETMAQEHKRQESGAESLSEQVAAAKDAYDAEMKRKSELDASVTESVERVRVVSETAAVLETRAKELNSDRQKTDARLKLLMEMQRDHEGYQHSVKQVLMQARRLGDTSGVRGVVAEIIKVPEKLERAIDMVLGGALQNIVVERDEDAKRMIEYLRANRFGRATFLPLTSVRGRTLNPQERRVLSMPGCIGLASEMLEYAPEYKGVMENLLGRTVIAEDLTSGIAIQRAGGHAFRLVTLEGDVMHSGGSMTGGSVQSRVTNLLSRSREIDETQAALLRIENELSDLNDELQTCEAERATLKHDRAYLYDELHRQEVSVARAEAQLNAALDEQKGHNERIHRAEADAERINAQILDVKASLEALTERESDAEQNTGSRQEEVRLLQEEIYTARVRVDAMRQAVSDERVALASGTRGHEAAIADRDKLIKQAANLDKLISDSETALAACENRLAENAALLEADFEKLTQGKQLLNESRMDFEASDKRRTDMQTELREHNETLERMRAEIDDMTEKSHRTELQLARVEGDLKQIQERIWQDYELTYAGAEPFRQSDFKLTESEKRSNAIRMRIRELGTVNVAALDDYRKTTERLSDLTEQRDDLIKAEDDLRGIILELERNMETQFKRQFEALNDNFARTFIQLFGGGKAELILTDPRDALNCDIDVIAQPPGKKLQMLSLLSGGERALTAIAILFAMLDLKPTPFCILDEIEAALDDANIDNFADYLKEYSRNTQFVVITHRKGTMERCDSLYGVVMEEKGVSKMVSVKLNEAAS